MSKIEYEMPEDHKIVAQHLLDYIEIRDNAIKALPNLPLHKRNEALKAIEELTKSIDKLEETLESEYKLHQEKCAKEEEFKEILTETEITSERIFIIIKHNHPDLFEKLKEIVLKDMSSEEIEEFYDRIAIREFYELKGLLDGSIQANSEQNY